MARARRVHLALALVVPAAIGPIRSVEDLHLEIEFLDEREVENRRPERVAGRFSSAGQESSMITEQSQSCSWTAPNLGGSSDDVVVHDISALQPSASINHMPRTVSADIEPSIATEPMHSTSVSNMYDMEQPVYADPASDLGVPCPRASHADDQRYTQDPELADDAFEIHDVPQLRDDLSLRLPENANHLVDVYFTYTHTWLPMIDRAATMQFFSMYSLAHQSPNIAQSSQAAVLWALLAHSSTQCTATKAPAAPESLSQEGRTEERRLYSIARGMIYRDHQSDLYQAQALLILSMVELRRGQAGTAWVMVGHAARIAIEQSHKNKLEHVDHQTSQMEKSTLLGCFVLDTLVSACLQRSPQLCSNDFDTLGELDENGLEEWDFWRPVPGLAAAGDQGPTMQSKPARVQSTFNRLCELMSIVNDKLIASAVRQPFSVDVSLRVRLQSWSQQFPAFRDRGGHKTGDKGPEIPNAMHLQACFYCTSMLLQPRHIGASATLDSEHAANQLSSNLDDFEKRFGPCAVPATCRLFADLFDSRSNPEHSNPPSLSGQTLTNSAFNSSTATVRRIEAGFVGSGDIPVFPSIASSPAASDLRRPHQAPVIGSGSNLIDTTTRPAQQPLFLPQFVEGTEASAQPIQISSWSNQGSVITARARSAREQSDLGGPEIGLDPILSETSPNLFQPVDTLNDGMFQEMLLEYERQNNESSEDFWRNLGYFE
ncbi:fungal-specific transcription factor domain-containing protein [Delphinella strobiligena]|nr:fungal-specific transcription factor domain-containing protein [Delphinella strobiligena]